MVFQPSKSIAFRQKKMSEIDFPPEVERLLQSRRFSDAIEYCKMRSIPYGAIIDKVHEVAEYANSVLNDEKNAQKSINLYITTIGIVEPSAILCRFFSPYLTRYLTQYLIELHFRGYAKEPDTRLLFSLFYHKEQRGDLENFIYNLERAKDFINSTKNKMPQIQARPMKKKKEKLKFNKEKKIKQNDLFYEFQRKSRFINNFKAVAAVEILVENEMDDYALKISKLFDVSKQIIDIMINKDAASNAERLENYKKATETIAKKIFSQEGKSLLMEFGPKLMRGDNEIGQLIENLAVQLWCDPNEHDDISFVKLFWGCPVHFKGFLEKAIHSKPTSLFVNSYIELLIPQNYLFKDHFNKNEKRSLIYMDNNVITNKKKVLEFIQDKSIPIDDINPLLFICTELNFIEGTIALLRRSNRLSDVISILISHNMTDLLIRWVNSKPELDGEDWVNILRYFISNEAGASNDSKRKAMLKDNAFMKNVLTKAMRARPLFALIKEISENPDIEFDVIMNELNSEIDGVISQLDIEEGKHSNLVNELKSIENEINSLEADDFEFKPKFCDKCRGRLYTPYAGFFCGHNFHLDCCEKIRNDYFCPLCHIKQSDNHSNQTQPQIHLDNNVNDLLEPTVQLIESGYYSQEKY